MTTTLVGTAIAIVLLLGVSGFFSGSETALTAVSRARMHQLEKDGSRQARAVNRLIADKENLIGTILLGNTFFNILLSSLATWALEHLLGGDAVAVATGAMTVLILIFAEVMPKTLAIARTDQFALRVSGALSTVVAVTSPIVRMVQWIVWRVLTMFGVRQEGSASMVPAHEEIRGAVALHHIEGAMAREHRDMIGGILDLRELRVADVMVHRKNVAMLDAELPRDALLQALLDTHHTRVPVWKGTNDNVIGVLNTKDVMAELVRRQGRLEDFDLLALMHDSWFVPDTRGVEAQL
ncbi:MAG: DUF21 domain-containing protein, partial [Alphaproteobacteria bacterium]|nr:DUF21 domain-containing protein [Alphaproteobacteria bacterium]